MGIIRRTFGVAVAALTLASVTHAKSPEQRTVWASRFEWPSANQATAKANIDNMMNTLVSNNFNTVLFQVRGQCDVHYPSPYEPWSDTYGWTNPGWDPLAYAIQAAHSRGIEFHAYINTHTLSQPIPPANTTPQHQYNLHGPNVPIGQSWLIRDTNGQTATSDNYYWISPGIPEASWWVRRAVMHVVQNYDVDGVHFDRIRTPAAIYSYDPVTVARFNGNGNPDGLGWADFMRSQITRDLRQIYGEIQYYKPNVKVSCSPFGIMYKDATTNYQGTGTQAYHSWYQDGWGWMKAHCVDFMVPMIYWEVGSAHPFEALLADWQNHSYGRFVVAGSTTNGASKTVSALQAEYQQTVLQNGAGHCVFSYGSMNNYWNSFKTGPYDQATTIPSMPWKTNPTFGYLVGYVRDKSGLPVLDATVNLAGDSYNYLSAYDGFFAVLEVPTTGPLTVAAAKAGSGSGMVSGITVQNGETKMINIVLRQSKGTVKLNKSQYTFGETAHIRLQDDDLEGSGSVNVSIKSNTEPLGEVVSLAEATTVGIFLGNIPLVTTGLVNPDGVLKIAPGDTVEVTYMDADDGTGNPAVATDTATVFSPPDIIIESRTPAGALTPVPSYQEFITTAGAWANTTAKSTAPGLTGSGGRFTGDNSVGSNAVFRPNIVTPGLYDVYITLPGATNGPNNHSPGAGFLVKADGPDVSGTFDLSRFNTALTNQWLLLTSNVKLAAGTGGSLRVTNNNPASASSGQRFSMDGVKFVFRQEAVNSAGTIDIGKPKYKPGDAARITVGDTDLQGAGTVSITVASGTEPVPEQVALAEIGSSGVFEGSIPLAAGAPVPGDGTLQVAHGDVVVASYVDADDGSGNSAVTTDTAVIDALAPAIANVAITNVTALSATVSFSTDEPSTGVVRYGTSCGDLTMAAASPAPSMSHIVPLTSLVPATTYSLVVDAADEAGNAATADNGGTCFQFATADQPMGLEEHFDSGNPPWQATGLWHTITSGNSCSTAATLPNAWYYGKDSGCNYDTGATNSGILFSPEFVAPPDAELNFSSREQTEDTGTSWDTRKVFVKPSGGTRTLLYQSTDRSNAWRSAGPISMAAYAGQAVSLEFEFNSVDSIGNTYLGWLVDDVVVKAADKLTVSPADSLVAAGPIGGPFTPASKQYTLANNGTVPVDWVSSHTETWFGVAPASGTLAAGETTSVVVFIDSGAASLLEGAYTDTLEFRNLGSGNSRIRPISLTVKTPPALPTNPDPADGATGVPVFPLISCSESAGADSYDLYFGKTNPPPLYFNSAGPMFFPPGNSYGLLDPNTKYYWRVNPKNAGGTTVGPAWSFTTVARGPLDYFSELFNANDFDLANQTLTFRPDSSPNFYAACRQSASAFPTDPAGGTPLSMTNDSSVQVTLSGGAKVWLYGVGYGSLRVCSNGFLTFTSTETTSYEHFYYHFASAKVSAFFHDLNPPANAVTWKQLSDRVAVTFSNVPTNGQTDSNNFQVEMFFDGTVRMTWLGMAQKNGLVGLSRGGGIPADFTETNLSSYGPCNPPAAPTGLTTTSLTQTQIGLAWTDNADNEATYTLERYTGSQFAPIAQLPPNTQGFLNTGLPADSLFRYRVYASNVWGASSYSNELNVRTLPYAPSGPSGLVANTVSQTQIDLAWVDNSNNEAGFRIERDSGSGFVEIATVGAGATAYSSTGLTANTPYSYRVRAYNAGGNSGYSNTASATTLPNPPAAPSNLGANTVSQTQVNLVWNDNSDNESGFRIERDSGSGYVEIATVGAGATGYANTGLTANTPYSYRVRAYNTGGNSAYSNVAQATTLPNPPAAPSGLGANPVSQACIDLAWTDNSDNEDGFRIERDSGAGFAEIATAGAGVQSYSDCGLTTNTQYVYRVRAYNTGGNSGYSGTATATTHPEPPAAPSSLAASALSASHCGLSWADNSSNESGFEIEWKSGTGAFSPVGVVPADSTVWTHTQATPGALNTYRVRAVNIGGASAWSNEASVVTPSTSGFDSGTEGWHLVGSPNANMWGDHDSTRTALRLTVRAATAPRVLGWGSPRLPLNANPNTIYRFKAYVFRSGQANPNDQRQIPNMRIRAAVRYSINSMLETFFHNNYDPTVDADMAPNCPSSDPANPTLYRVDLDPVDVPYLASGANPDEGVSAMFEVYALEPQENGSLELAEGVLCALPAPAETSLAPLKTYAASASDAGDLKKGIYMRTTVNGMTPLPSIDDSTTYGLVIDTTACPWKDIAIAAAEIDAGASNSQRPRVEAGKQYRLRWHVTSGRATNLQSQLRMRARTLKFSWSQKYEIGGAWPTSGVPGQVIAQQALPGIGTQNPDKTGREIPGVWDGGWYTMYFHPPVVVPAGQPGPGSVLSSRRDLKCALDVIDTLSNGPGAAQEGGLFAVDRIEVSEFPAIGD